MNNNIKLADFSHKKELTELWIEAFGDDEKFIAGFLDAYMIPEYNVPIIIEDGKIASALYLVEFDLYSNTNVLGSCAYLFAAATKKEYQNKGFMSRLVLYSAKLYQKRGIKAIFLFPQAGDKKLFDFYAKAGFEAIYAANRIIYKSNEKRDLTGLKLESEDITNVEIFDGLYDSYVDFTSRQELAPMKDRLFYFKCASCYLETPGNNFAVFEKESENNVEKICYVFYKKYKNTYYIDDIILPVKQNGKENFDKAADMLAGYILNSGKFGDNITLGMNTLPNPGQESQNVPLAMLLPLADNISGITDDLKSPVYINMFMNI